MDEEATNNIIKDEESILKITDFPNNSDKKQEILTENFEKINYNDCEMGEFSMEVGENKNNIDPHEITHISLCPMCPKKFSNSKDTSEHLSKLHKIPFEIQEALKVFHVKEVALTRTLFFIDSEFETGCYENSATTKEENEIKETFVCPKCGANFGTNHDAENHLEKIHHIPSEIRKNNPDLIIERRDIRNIC